MMADDVARRVEATPSGDAGAQSEFGVVSISEQILVETADSIQHRLTIHGGTAIGPQHLFHPIELPAVALPGASSAILTVGVDEMTSFVDHARLLPNHDLGCRHSQVGP